MSDVQSIFSEIPTTDQLAESIFGTQMSNPREDNIGPALRGLAGSMTLMVYVQVCKPNTDNIGRKGHSSLRTDLDVPNRPNELDELLVVFTKR